MDLHFVRRKHSDLFQNSKISLELKPLFRKARRYSPLTVACDESLIQMLLTCCLERQQIKGP